MDEDIAIVAGVLVMLAIGGWCFVHVVRAARWIPTDELCRLATDCVTLFAR